VPHPPPRHHHPPPSLDKASLSPTFPTQRFPSRQASLLPPGRFGPETQGPGLLDVFSIFRVRLQLLSMLTLIVVTGMGATQVPRLTVVFGWAGDLSSRFIDILWTFRLPFASRLRPNPRYCLKIHSFCAPPLHLPSVFSSGTVCCLCI